MTSGIVAERHMASSKHMKRFEQRSSEVNSVGAGSPNVEQLDAQGIEWRDGAYWCSACNSGPMTSAVVAEKHVATPKHVRRLEDRQALHGKFGDATSAALQSGDLSVLPEMYVSQGIIAVPESETGGLRTFKCTLCDAGPFNAVKVIDAHISSKKHQNRASTAGALRGAGGVASSDPVAEIRWNLPDYIEEEWGKPAGHLRCQVCDVGSTAVIPMLMHVGGDKHAKKSRANGHEEVVYVK